MHLHEILERQLWKENHNSVHSEAMLFNFKRVDKNFYEYFIYAYIQTSKF